MKNEVYISLGTNQGERVHLLQAAIKILAEHPNVSIKEFSSIYETAPVGYTEQPKFLNMVIKVLTSLRPLELLDFTQEIENQLGRKRDIRWGPRTIDLDILLYNNENIKSERLFIPHPRMFERAFVVVPLFEINHELVSKYNIDVENLRKDQHVSLFSDRNHVFKV